METDKWLTLDELAEYLKLSKSNIYRMTQKGEVPASKIGSRWRFDRDEIYAWMKNQKTNVDQIQVKDE
jgi:excisionase family DNA binding protein